MKALLLIGTLALSFSAYAGNSTSRGKAWAASLGCGDSPHGRQRVYAYSGSTQLEGWNVDPNAVHREKLPNGYTVGVKIEPVAASVYRSTPFRNMRYSPELVKVSLYDVSFERPRMLDSKFAGANSIQSYNDKNDASHGVSLGSPGLTLILQKPTCVPLVATQ